VPEFVSKAEVKVVASAPQKMNIKVRKKMLVRMWGREEGMLL
jgi:hypothetical protein